MALKNLHTVLLAPSNLGQQCCLRQATLKNTVYLIPATRNNSGGFNPSHLESG